MAEISRLPAPDTQPTSALPIPLPPSLPSKPASLPSLKSFQSWAPFYLSKTDATISRLSKILSTPQGTDTVLLTTCYTTLLLSNILQKLSVAQLKRSADIIIKQAIELPPNTTVLISSSAIPISRLSVSAARLKALSSLISDFRIFARLWGLLGIYSWGKSVWKTTSGEKDMVLRGVEYIQVLVNIGFQYLENGAYLSSKNVLGWTSEKQNSAWLWSSRFWMAHVVLDFVRLGRERALRAERRESAKGKEVEKSDGVMAEEERAWREGWMKQLLVNSAWMPLTAHWSVEGGLVSEFWIGVCGSVAGVAGLRTRWRDAGL